MKLDLGDEVRDSITGLTGIVVAKSIWLNGCVRLTVQPEGLKDGQSIKPETIDIEQLVLVTENKTNCQYRDIIKPAVLEHKEPEPLRRTGGPFPEIVRADVIS